MSPTVTLVSLILSVSSGMKHHWQAEFEIWVRCVSLYPHMTRVGSFGALEFWSFGVCTFCSGRWLLRRCHAALYTRESAECQTGLLPHCGPDWFSSCLLNDDSSYLYQVEVLNARLQPGCPQCLSDTWRDKKLCSQSGTYRNKLGLKCCCLQFFSALSDLLKNLEWSPRTLKDRSAWCQARKGQPFLSDPVACLSSAS